MDYSPLIPRDEEGPCDHPLLEFQDLDEIKKVPLDFIEEMNDQEDIFKRRKDSTKSNNNRSSGGKSGSKLFGRSLSKSKSASEDVSPYVIEESEGTQKKKMSSSPIEIKGSPGKHNRDGSLNKSSSAGRDNSNGSTTTNNRISFFKVLTRRNSTTNQGKHKSKHEHFLFIFSYYYRHELTS